MDREGQYTILFSGFLGVVLATLTARPKQIIEGVYGVLAGLFGCLVLAPGVAEALTNISIKFSTLSWLNAAPGTALFQAIIGLGGMLGFQLVILIKSDFLDWIKKFARNRFNKLNNTPHNGRTTGEGRVGE